MTVGDKFKKIFNLARVEAERHMPEILTGMSIAGTVSTAIFAIKGTPKAMKLIEQKKKDLGKDRLTWWETVKTCWKCYIPMSLSAVVSAGSAIGSDVAGRAQQAAIATALTGTELFIDQIAKKADELYGPGGYDNIVQQIQKDKEERAPIVMVAGRGAVQCYDSISDRYFLDDPSKIRTGIARLNAKLYSDDFVTVNDYLVDALHLPPIEGGEDRGWSIDDGYIEPYYDSVLQPDTDIPSLAIMFSPSRGPNRYCN